MLLVPFTLNSTLLEGQITGLNKAQCKLFIEFWLRNGVLFHDGDEIGSSAVLKSFIRHNRNLFKLFDKAHKKLRSQSMGNSPLNLDNFGSFQGIRESFPKIKEILVEDNFNNQVLELPDGESLYDPELEMEVARMSEVGACELYENAKDESEKNVEEGDDIASIWESRFSQLADISKRVSIVDRFCATESHDCPGLKYLLRKLCSASAHKSMVTIYSAHSHAKPGGGSYSPQDVASNIKRIRGKLKDEFDGDLGSIRELRLICAPNGTFATHAADRYIRFDHTVLEVGHGTKIFSQGYRTQQNNMEDNNPDEEGAAGYSNHFVRKIYDQTHRNVQNTLKDRAGRNENIVIFSSHPD